MSKIEMLKRLKYLIAFQANSFSSRNWKEADLAENEIEKLEGQILNFDISEIR